MSFAIYDGCPGPGFWERDNSHFPLPMSRHLWELFLPVYDAGTRRGLSRYGSLIDHFDFGRVKGRLYLKTCFVAASDLTEREARIQASAEAVSVKLWRQDCEDWQNVREQMCRRLLEFSAIDPALLNLDALRNHITSLRSIFVDGTLRHFVQQPSSMFPVGDWVRSACEWTGCAQAEALALLIGSHSGSADFWELPARIDEYADRIITGFDLVDLTLRELPQLHSGTLSSRTDADARSQQHSVMETMAREARLRERVPAKCR